MDALKRLLHRIVASRVSIGIFAKSSVNSIKKPIVSAEHAVQNMGKAAGKYWKKLGPGLTTGAADDDPSGIATYSQAGAQFGNRYLWLALFTYPLMSAVQEMCARIGLVTNRGLAGNIRMYFPKWILYFITFLLFAANSFNIGADLGAMAEATQLLFPQASFIILVIAFTIFSLVLQIFTSYKTYAKYLKWLALILFSYVFASFAVDLDWGSIIRDTFTPQIRFDKESILLIAAVLGTTISPYLFFWQTSQEVEEKNMHEVAAHEGILHGQADNNMAENKLSTELPTNISAVVQTAQTEQQPGAHTSKEEMKDMRVDVWSGMFISNLVMFFIIIVCSATLFANGITNIQTAADAANALRPLAGDFAYLLFAIGIIGTGLLAVPILAGSTSYAIAESFRFVSGLHYKFKEAYAFYAVIIVSVIVGLGLNFIGLDPIKALIYSAIANCIVAPLVLVFIVLISSNKKIMGQYVNRPLTTTVGWLVTLLMFLVAGVTCWTLL